MRRFVPRCRGGLPRARARSDRLTSAREGGGRARGTPSLRQTAPPSNQHLPLDLGFLPLAHVGPLPPYSSTLAQSAVALVWCTVTLAVGLATLPHHCPLVLPPSPHDASPVQSSPACAVRRPPSDQRLQGRRGTLLALDRYVSPSMLTCSCGADMERCWSPPGRFVRMTDRLTSSFPRARARSLLKVQGLDRGRVQTRKHIMEVRPSSYSRMYQTVCVVSCLWRTLGRKGNGGVNRHCRRASSRRTLRPPGPRLSRVKPAPVLVTT